MEKRICIEPWSWYFAALLIITVPAGWLFAAVCAAVFHELCHMAAILILGGTVQRVTAGIGGIVIHSEITGKGKELLAALAGPVGSFALLHLCHVFPKLAVCGCIQGLFNLLPVYPLDGGRILGCCVEWLCPLKSNKILKWTEGIVYSGVFLISVVVSVRFSVGWYPVFLSCFLIIKASRRKRPCKWRRIGVQ